MPIPRTQGKFRCISFSFMCFVYFRLMMWPVSSSIVIRAITFSHHGPEGVVVRWVVASCRNESRLEYHPASPTISTSRLHSWMFVRARDLTPLHEDEMWMIQATAVLSLLCLWLVAPAASREGMTRRWALSLFAFARHHLQRRLVGRIAQRK